MKIKYIVNVVANIVVVAMFVVLFYIVSKMLLFDTFPVNTRSMFPTIIEGDKVLVDKTIFGARIYTDFDFSEDKKMESIRVKGIRKIKRNDLVIFNHETRDTIRFVINHVYLKRCVGLPGDTVSIVDGIYRNSVTNDSLGLLVLQKRVNNMDFESNVLDAYNFAPEFGWTIKNFGPLYVPRKGDVLNLDKNNLALYRRYIQYEEGDRFRIVNDSTATIDSAVIKHYRFKTNYYFMAGDNVFDSHDSRYFGLVPEEFIVGVASVIVFSKDKYSDRIRCERIFKRI